MVVAVAMRVLEACEALVETPVVAKVKRRRRRGPHGWPAISHCPSPRHVIVVNTQKSKA